MANNDDMDGGFDLLSAALNESGLTDDFGEGEDTVIPNPGIFTTAALTLQSTHTLDASPVSQAASQVLLTTAQGTPVTIKTVRGLQTLGGQRRPIVLSRTVTPSGLQGTVGQVQVTAPTPGRHVQLTRAQTPVRHVQLTRAQTPVGHLQVTRAQTPVGHLQVTRAQTPLRHLQVTRAQTPVGHVQLTRAQTPVGHLQVTRAQTPLRHVQVTRAQTPVGQIQVTRSQTPVGQIQVTRAQAPVGQIQVSRAQAPGVLPTVGSPRFTILNASQPGQAMLGNSAKKVIFHTVTPQSSAAPSTGAAAGQKVIEVKEVPGGAANLGGQLLSKNSNIKVIRISTPKDKGLVSGVSTTLASTGGVKPVRIVTIKPGSSGQSAAGVLAKLIASSPSQGGVRIISTGSSSGNFVQATSAQQIFLSGQSVTSNAADSLRIQNALATSSQPVVSTSNHVAMVTTASSATSLASVLANAASSSGGKQPCVIKLVKSGSANLGPLQMTAEQLTTNAQTVGSMPSVPSQPVPNSSLLGLTPVVPSIQAQANTSQCVVTSTVIPEASTVTNSAGNFMLASSSQPSIENEDKLMVLKTCTDIKTETGIIEDHCLDIPLSVKEEKPVFTDDTTSHFLQPDIQSGPTEDLDLMDNKDFIKAEIKTEPDLDLQWPPSLDTDVKPDPYGDTKVNIEMVKDEIIHVKEEEPREELNESIDGNGGTDLFGATADDGMDFFSAFAELKETNIKAAEIEAEMQKETSKVETVKKASSRNPSPIPQLPVTSTALGRPQSRSRPGTPELSCLQLGQGTMLSLATSSVGGAKTVRVHSPLTVSGGAGEARTPITVIKRVSSASQLATSLGGGASSILRLGQGGQLLTQAGAGGAGQMVLTQAGAGDAGKLVFSQAGAGGAGQMVLTQAGAGGAGKLVFSQAGAGGAGQMVLTQAGAGGAGKMVLTQAGAGGAGKMVLTQAGAGGAGKMVLTQAGAGGAGKMVLTQAGAGGAGKMVLTQAGAGGTGQMVLTQAGAGGTGQMVLTQAGAGGAGKMVLTQAGAGGTGQMVLTQAGAGGAGKMVLTPVGSATPGSARGGAFSLLQTSHLSQPRVTVGGDGVARILPPATRVRTPIVSGTPTGSGPRVVVGSTNSLQLQGGLPVDGNGLLKKELTDKDVLRLWSNDDVKLKKIASTPNIQAHSVSSYQEAAARVEMEEMEAEVEELGHAETYAEYMPAKLKIGQKHPDSVVETSSLSSVEPAAVWYNMSIPEDIIDYGYLSALQLETIVYACQKHQAFLPSGERAGFLIGDGAGVGKGRTIAGIIYENYLLGRKRSLWLSVSSDLRVDAERDLRDIGAGKIEVHALNKFKYAKISSHINNSVKKGVIFATYSSLIGESQSSAKYRTRMKQLIHWLGKDFDGLIVFDECHRAKNLCPVGSSKPTKTGLTVLQLQEKLPKARIIYASATGASEPKNMAYMTRLGLWGKGTPFSEFNDFIQAVEKRGVGAMEMVAMDMKLRGIYIARQLSFHGVSFKIEEIPIPKDFIHIYNSSVELWVEAREKFQEAARLINAEQRMRKTMWGQFWSSHQRFFKYLCISAKVKHCVRTTREAIKNGKCVVIGLQSTGEARTLEQLEDGGGELNDFVSTAKGVLQSLVEKHFPAPNRRKTMDLFGWGSNMFNESPVPSPASSTGSKRKRPGGKGPSSKKPRKNWADGSDDDSASSGDSGSDGDKPAGSSSGDEDEEEEEEEESDMAVSESSEESEADFNPFGDGSDSDEEMR